MRPRNIVVVLCVLGAAACGDKKEKDPAADFVAESTAKDVAELKAAIASPDPGSAKFNCAHMANIETLESAAEHKALAAELRTLCTKDLHVAMIKVAVEKAEAARKAKPDEEMLSECFSVDYELAKDELTEHKTLDAAKDLVARFQAACPDAK
jgi:hypothetical protein